MMNKYRKLLGVSVVVVLVLIVGITAVALAQDDETPLPTEPSVTAPELFSGDGPRLNQQGRGSRQQFDNNQRREQLFAKDEMDAALAAELGISVEELDAAREAARATLLQQAVDEGRLTQEQADQMLAGEFKPVEFMRTMREEYFPQGTAQAVTAETLGMTVEELEAAQEAGQRLPEIAEEQGVELTAVTEAIRAAFEEAVAQAVADGVITQEQADQILSQEGRLRGSDGPRGGSPRGGTIPRGQGLPGGSPRGNGG